MTTRDHTPAPCCAASRLAAPGRATPAPPAARAAPGTAAPAGVPGQGSRPATGPRGGTTGARGRAAPAPPPVRGAGPAPPATPASPRHTPPDGMVYVPGGEFLMGTDDREGFPADGEGPVRRVRVKPFNVDRTAVTNAQFAEFVKATHYKTEAEAIGWSFVFNQFVTPRGRTQVLGSPAQAPWWLAVKGAYWAKPEGPDSGIRHRRD